MSPFKFSKKLQPTRKAWKSFKTKILSHPKFTKRIKTFGQSCLITFQTLLAFLRRKLVPLTKRPHLPHSTYHRHQFHLSSSTVYVDQLFPYPSPLAEATKNMAESSNSASLNKSRNHSNAEGKSQAGESSTARAATDRWKLPMLPQFRGIDERAEEFIAKFRQGMKLEREQSLLEFEEMLKRSA